MKISYLLPHQKLLKAVTVIGRSTWGAKLVIDGSMQNGDFIGVRANKRLETRSSKMLGSKVPASSLKSYLKPVFIIVIIANPEISLKERTISHGPKTYRDRAVFWSGLSRLPRLVNSICRITSSQRFRLL